MSNIESFATGPMWAGFIAFVVVMLALDLFVLGGNKAHRVSVKEAGSWVVAWMLLATTFGALLWWYLDGTAGREIANRKALEFFTGYLIEQTLSVDNMFVFVMIFTYFAVPPELQRRVLLYGVIGAIVMRAGMIMAGVWLVSEFAWVLYVFGAFLVVTGIKMLVMADQQPDLGEESLPALAARPHAHHPGLSWRGLLCAHQRPALCDAHVPGADDDRGQRPGVCRGQHPGHFCGDHRSVHRLHLQHLRHHGTEGAVLSVG